VKVLGILQIYKYVYIYIGLCLGELIWKMVKSWELIDVSEFEAL